MANNVLTDNLSEALHGATAARVAIDTDTGNLTIDRLTGGEQLLATGTLEYFEQQGPPTRTFNATNGQVTLRVKGGGGRRSLFRLPWAACNGAFAWQIHLNPTISSDITAHSGGGNVQLNLAGMVVTHVMADTGGGNMDVVLPDNAANLDVSARTGGGNVTVAVGSSTTGSNTVSAHSGAGNVVVLVPGGLAARVHAHSGLGQVTVDPRFSRVDKQTYQSPDYDAAANKIELTLDSGAGNVIVSAN